MEKRNIGDIDEFELLKEYGFLEEVDGKMIIKYTNVEKTRIDETLLQLKGKTLNPDFKDEFVNMLTAIALVGLGDEFSFQNQTKKATLDQDADYSELEEGS